MRALRMTDYRKPLEITDVPDPEPGPDGAVVRVTACGICRTDWHIWNGDWTWGGMDVPKPLTLGHEVAGVVEAVGPQVDRVRVGQRVTIPFHMACGQCHFCRAGRQNLCDDLATAGTDVDGGWAELLHVPHANLNAVALPDEIGDLAGSTLGCRYMTAYRGVTARGHAAPGEWVGVFGCGGVGLSAVQIATAAGAYVVAVDLDVHKLDLARAHGAVAVVDAAGTDDVPSAVQDLTGGGTDLSVAALGRHANVLNALWSLRKGGRLAQIGLTSADDQGTLPLPLDVFVQREWELIGSNGNPHSHYRELLRQVRRGTLRPQDLVTRQVGLEQVGDVLASMGDFETVGYEILTFDGVRP